MTILSITEFEPPYHHSREINAVLADGLHLRGTLIKSVDLVYDVETLELDTAKGLLVIRSNLELYLLHNVHEVLRRCLLNCGYGI